METDQQQSNEPKALFAWPQVAIPNSAWVTLAAATSFGILWLIVVLGPGSYNAPTSWIDAYGGPYRSDMVALLGAIFAVGAARMFMRAFAFVGTNRVVRPILELQIGTGISAFLWLVSTFGHSHAGLITQYVVVIVELAVEYFYTRRLVKKGELQPEGVAPSFLGLKITGWVIGALPVLLGVVFMPNYFVPAAVAMVILTLRPWKTAPAGKPAPNRTPAELAALVTANPEQHLLNYQVRDWNLAGRPDLAPWFVAGKPDFDTWLEEQAKK